MENIDPNDTMIHTDIIKAINETAQDRLIALRDRNHEARADSERADTIVLTAHAHQVVFVSEIDVNVGVTNIHVLSHPYGTCHVQWAKY